MRILANGRAQASEVEQCQLQFLETGMFNITLGNILCANVGYQARYAAFFKLCCIVADPKNKLFNCVLLAIERINVCLNKIAFFFDNIFL